jgi:hypothetical protein
MALNLKNNSKLLPYFPRFFPHILFRRLLLSQSRLKDSDQRSVDLQDKCHALRLRLDKWLEVQRFYMPGTAELCADSTTESSDNISYPEKTPLYLPSSIPAASRLAMSGALIDKERRMRIAQADDALEDLKRLLRITMGLWDYKLKQIGPSQRASTRTRAMIDRYREKINRCADRYRAARATLLSLDPQGNWTSRLQELKANDVRPPRREKDDASLKPLRREKDKEGEGTREVSWIWMVQRKDDDLEDTELTTGEVDDCRSFQYPFISLSRC